MPSNNQSSKPESFLPTAGTLSVTVIHDPSKSYGLRLAQHRRSEANSTNISKQNFESAIDSDYCDHESDNVDVVIDMIANTHSNAMLKGSPLKEGDILKTINNRRAINFLGCGNSNNNKGFCSFIKGGSFQECVTLVAERPPQTGDCGRESSHSICVHETQSDLAVVQAFCRKSKTNNNNNSDNKSNDDKPLSVGVEFRRVVIREEDEKIQEKGSCASNTSFSDSENDDEASCCSDSSSRSSCSSSFLQINRIDPNGLFAHSVLNQGDIVLAINGYSVCADENLTAEEANELLGIHPDSEALPSSPSDKGSNLGVSVYDMVDILALNPRKLIELRRHQYDSTRPTLWERGKMVQMHWMKKKAKKAGVAIGGGTMVGAGLVIHPFGPLLMAGGMSVLGTEFEFPRKIVRNTRDSFEKWAEKEEVAHDGPEISPRSNTEPLSTEREDCNSDMNIDQSCQVDTRTSNNSMQSRLPLPNISNRMKGFGRRYVLPFLDRMAGDRQNTSIEPASSFDIHDSNNNNHNDGEANTHRYKKEMILKNQQPQLQQLELQGRDDDFSQMYDSSLEDDRKTIVTLERIP